MDKLQNFVFKAMLLDSTFGTLGEAGLDVRGEQAILEKSKETIDLDDFPMEIRMDAIKMAKVYTAFFCFENSVRELVSQRLVESVGINWWDKVSSKIQKKVDSRIEKEKKNKWHSPRAKDKIAYCDFGDLCDIIINNWEYFDNLFPNQDWVKTRLNDLEPSRNTIAHNSVLSEHDMQRISMFLKDWLLQVG